MWWTRPKWLGREKASSYPTAGGSTIKVTAFWTFDRKLNDCWENPLLTFYQEMLGELLCNVFLGWSCCVSPWLVFWSLLPGTLRPGPVSLTRCFHKCPNVWFITSPDTHITFKSYSSMKSKVQPTLSGVPSVFWSITLTARVNSDMLTEQCSAMISSGSS